MTDPEANPDNATSPASRNQPRPPGLTDDEWRLVRMYRCMNERERSSTLIAMCHALMLRSPLDPELEPEQKDGNGRGDYSLPTEDRENLANHLSNIWPCNWPNRGFVDMQNFGDPGAWVRNALLSGMYHFILGTGERDDEWTDLLLDSYLGNEDVQEYALPTEFGVSQDDMEEQAKQDFQGFLTEYRESVLRALEDRTRKQVGIPQSQPHETTQEGS